MAGRSMALATELRGLVQATNRTDHRLRKLEVQEG